MVNISSNSRRAGSLVAGLFFWMACLSSSLCLGQTLTTAWTGTIDQANYLVTNLPANGRVIQLLSATNASAGATVRVVSSTGQAVSKQAPLVTGMVMQVNGTAGATASYTLQLGTTSIAVQNLTNVTGTVANFSNSILNISGNSACHITAAYHPLPGSLLDLQSDNVWLYFDNIKPSVFYRGYLAHILINGQRAKVDTTVRVVQYLQGCVVISQPSTYQALQVFTAANYGGTSRTCDLYTYYAANGLTTTFNNNIASFKLKKGYMATFAENENGTGSSKVYIAADNDVEIASLPAYLQGNISLVRVMPWRWVAKKGWTSGYALADTLRCHWNYNWNNNQESTLDEEYVPIRQTRYWPGIPTLKKNVTHLLGYNEPNNTSTPQNLISPQTAMRAWPDLLQTGLRVGSPSPTDGGLSWLYSFMDKCDSANYRVDYIAMHFYRGCYSASQYYNFLKGIYDRTHRPIWVTEFNNGANWTTSTGCPAPTYAEQASKIQSFITMLDTASFVERYSLYEWVQPTRQMFYGTNPISLTPAGIVYRGQNSPMAYNPNLTPPSATVAPPVPFGYGNLVITRYGNPTWAGGTGVTLPVYIDEVAATSNVANTAGQVIRSIAIPAQSWGPNFAYTGSAMKSNADGSLCLSPDRSKVALAGFNLATGQANPNGGPATRVVAILDADGKLDTRTGFSDGANQPMRCAAVTDSATVYIAYGNNSYGLRHAALPSAASVVPVARTGTTIFPTISLKKMAMYENELYFTASTTGQAKVQKLNGLPATASTPVALPGIPAVVSGGTQPTGFVIFDVNPNVPGFDLLYFADDATASGLNKYSFDGTTWTARGTYTVAGLNDNALRDLTGTLVRGVPTLYAVSYTAIVKMVDASTTYTLATSNYTNNIAITQTVLTDNLATVSYAYRGVSFAPGTRDSLYVRTPQSISFAAIPNKYRNDPDFNITASSSAGLELGAVSSDTAVATIYNGRITIKRPGTTQITASQPGNYKYLRAASVTRTLTVLTALASASTILKREVTLSPNPTHGEVQLGLPASLQRESVRVHVLNMLGQNVGSYVLPAGAGASRPLPLAGLAAGVYTVRLETSAGTINKRLVCE